MDRTQRALDVTVEKIQERDDYQDVQHIRVGWVVWRKGRIRHRRLSSLHLQTYILEDFIEGGKYRNQLDQATKERIDTAYQKWMSM